MTASLELGAHLPLLSFTGEQRDHHDLLAYARTARDLGYQWLTANDHLTFARPWLDGPTALASVLTERGEMTIATTVALPVVRGAAATAKALAALDLLTDGNLVAGVGPGSAVRDHELAGLDFGDRWTALDGAVVGLRRHWRAGPDALLPLPARPGGPPIWIGSWGSAAGLRRVARRGDGWLASAYNTTPDRFAAARRELTDRLRAEGRGDEPFPNGLATMWTYVTEDGAEADHILRTVLTPLLRRDADELRHQVAVGSPGHVRELFEAYAAAGAQRVFVWPVADERRQLERVRELLPTNTEELP